MFRIYGRRVHLVSEKYGTVVHVETDKKKWNQGNLSRCVRKKKKYFNQINRV